MPYFMKPLLCFDPWRYKFISSPNDGQCISPTKDGNRCSFRITPAELEEVGELMEEAALLSDSDERVACLERLVLLRICGNVHRKKVEHEGNCLRAVAQMYSRMSREASSSPRTPPRPPRRESTPREADSPTWRESSGKVRERYQLRPREAGRAITSLKPSVPGEEKQYFVPKKTYEDINVVLQHDVPREYVNDGHLYAYTWPTNPGFVKIGYTKHLELRMQEWSKCNAGAALLTSISIQFPQRMEELVHLELAAVRHEIVHCKSCAGSHIEWFKASDQDVKRVIDDWRAVNKRETLYSIDDRHLSKRWQRRIKCAGEKVTARKLLSFLDAEAEAEHAKAIWDGILTIWADVVAMLAQDLPTAALVSTISTLGKSELAKTADTSPLNAHHAAAA